MASFTPIKGTRTQIGNTPIVEGQLLVEIDQNADNRIYLDKGTGTGNRIVVGGNADYAYISPTTAMPVAGTGASVNIVFTSNLISANCKLQPFSELCNSAGTPLTGANSLVPLSFSNIVVDTSGTTPTCTVSVVVPNAKYYNFLLKVSV